MPKANLTYTQNTTHTHWSLGARKKTIKLGTESLHLMVLGRCSRKTCFSKKSLFESPKIKGKTLL